MIEQDNFPQQAELHHLHHPTSIFAAKIGIYQRIAEFC
ncbi:hypothetical protein H4W33_009884 [Kibdelosporangium phytohabitans]|nr:hypothetical protein [Kibdelosporangium phytohabitans]